MKKNLKKILAFLCAVVLFVTAVFTENAMNQAEAETETSTQATSTEPTPVKLKGFKNLTIGDFLDSNREKLMPGKYTEGFYRQALGVKNMNNTLFSTRITYHSGFTEGYRSSLLLGGAGEWQGFNIHPSTDGTILYIEDTWSVGGAGTLPNGSIAINASDVVVEKFVDDEFLLQLSFEYGEADASNKTTFTLGVYIEGELYNKYDISNWDMNYVGNYLQLYQQENTGITLENVELREEPVVVDGFDNITITDFTKSDGTTLSAGTYMGEMSSSLKDESSFNNKLLSMYVTYTGGGTWNNSITLAGKAMYNSFALRPNNEGTELQFVTGDWGSSIATDVSFIITAEEAGVSSFVDNEFLLQISFLYGTETNGTADLTLGIYVDGKDCGTKTFTGCNMANTGTSLCTVIYDPTNKNIILDEVTFDPFAGYDMISVEDFVDASGKEMESKAYAYDAATPNSTFSLKNASETFANKLLSMKVKFGYKTSGDTNYDMRMVIGGENAWSGIFVYVNADDELCIDNYVAPEAYERINAKNTPASSFLNTQFTLQMAFKDTSNGLAVKVFIDGTLCGNFTWSGVTTSDYNNQIHLRRNLKDSFIIVSDPDAEEFPADPAIMPDPSFERITFGSFGIKDGTYSADTPEYTYNGSLHQKVLCGKVKFEGGSWFNVRLGGSAGTWDEGLYLAPVSEESMEVNWRHEGEFVGVNDVTSFTSDIAGVKFKGQEYDLMVSFEVVDVNEDQVNDVRFGVWFDNQLYGERYYTVNSVGDSLGNKLALGIPGGTVTLDSVAEYLPQPDSNYERITFQHFLVEDGEYESQGAEWFIHNSFKKKDDLDKVVVCGDVQLNGGNSTYMLALGEKNADPYSGIFMWISGETMTLSIQDSTTIQAAITSKEVGVGDSFVGNPFSLMWSVEFVDSVIDDGDTLMNDVKVQLWFDGYLCVDKIFVDGGTAEELGNTLAICCPGEGDSITLNSSSKITNLPGEEFGKLSLSDFEHNGTSATMESGTYVAGDQPSWLISGKAKDCETLDKKVVSLDILQSGTAGNATTTGTQYQMRIGGAGGDWYGLALNTTNTGTIDIGWCKLDGSWAQVKDGSQFMSVDVNNAIYNNQPNVSSIVNETFNLMVSMEVVDANSNDVDDVKVRIWFNKIPFVYNGMDSFIYLDCGDSIGNNFTAGYITKNAGEKAFVSLRNVAEYQSNPNYYEDITQFRQSTGYTYPEVEGKIFAGWYTDADYKTVLNWKKTEGSAYAKFVDDEVLRVKSQVALDANKKIPTDKTTLRFVTTVDSLMYKRVGFKYQVQGENGNYSNQLDSYNSYTGTYESGKNPANMVYKTMYYVGNNDNTMSYEPDAFSWQSEYFKAWSLTDINASQYHLNVKITPYWITKDGTLVLGEEREICVNDSPTEDTSASATIDFLGKNTMPIAGYGIWNNSDIFDMNGIDEKIFPDYDEEQYFEMFADAGINLINRGNEDYAINPSGALRQLENGTKYGLGVFVNDSKLLDITDATELSERLKEYSSNSKYESFSGLYLVDEPTTQDYGFAWSTLEGGEALYTNYKSTAELLNAEFENTEYLTYCNLFPIRDVESNFWQDIWSSSDITKADKDAYKEYVNTINTNLNSKVISYDYYPFEDTRIVGEKYDYNLYFWNMDLIRTTALSANNGKGKPFWAYVQVGSQWKDPKTQLGENDNAEDYTLIGGTYYKKGAFDSDYYPSESQFNWIVNTSLAFGAQGIQYFPLIQPIQFAYDSEKAEYDFEVNGVLSAWGGKTQWYYYAQEINKHIAEIDEVLMNAKTQKVVVPASGNAKTQTDGLSSVATSYGVLNGVTGDALVGYFNYGGKVALYVANNQHWAVGEEAEAKSQDVTLNLAYDYNEIIKYENAERQDDIETTNKQLKLTMEAGEGILLVLDGRQE